MIVEAIGGIRTNSLALLSNAGHMLSDAAALELSLLAFKIGEKNRITKDSLHILMEGKPQNVNKDSMTKTLAAIEGVEDVQDIHVWSITSEFSSMSCHLVVNESINRDEILIKANQLIKTQFDISHCTIQIEGIHSGYHNDCDFCN